MIKHATGYYFAQKNGEIRILREEFKFRRQSNLFGDQNQILIRYAEVLLSRAECKVHTGDISGAMDDLKLSQRIEHGVEQHLLLCRTAQILMELRVNP